MRNRRVKLSQMPPFAIFRKASFTSSNVRILTCLLLGRSRAGDRAGSNSHHSPGGPPPGEAFSLVCQRWNVLLIYLAAIIV